MQNIALELESHIEEIKTFRSPLMAESRAKKMSEIVYNMYGRKPRYMIVELPNAKRFAPVLLISEMLEGQLVENIVLIDDEGYYFI